MKSAHILLVHKHVGPDKYICIVRMCALYSADLVFWFHVQKNCTLKLKLHQEVVGIAQGCITIAAIQINYYIIMV